jgi:hypothetical protein
MATNETSLVRTDVCACRFAIVAIANLQRAWTLLIKPLTVSLHASFAAIQVAFAVLIPSQTRLVPVKNYIPDRLSPRAAGECGPTLPRYETESTLVL